ncbi:MAG: peptidase M16 [Gammaproteobacteria bacterium]|nr:peptidase M16 [Gammaproteobacteria bacterium]NIR58741.1 peptidase M16 [Gammaproteobacteria bacterium]NIR88595.1 peptidase M16 [Gammaproteobacteria bacterium]
MTQTKPARRRWIAALWIACLGTLALAGARAEVVKSPNDPRDYRAFRLPNRLQVLVISDPETDKAAAAMDVFVGSGSDPEGREGMAHFLEHMLFLGTESYPEAGEYQSFISAHGGDHNAYTAFEHTNYFFDVESRHLEAALNRFAQSFIAPLFNPDYVVRERNIVHSEYVTRREDDGRRVGEAKKLVMNPRHPFSDFAIGSRETLADRGGRSVRAELLRFYREHYSANLMALVVLGREPVAVLERWVREKFAAVPNTQARPSKTQEPLFGRGQLPARLHVLPVKDRQALTLTFPIPAVDAHYRSKPTAYIANLLGHEGRGSLLSLLKREGWATGLSAYTAASRRDGAAFEVRISLTDEGLQRIDDIASRVFQYLALVRERGVASWIFEEQRQLARTAFRFREKEEPGAYVSALARRLQVRPPRDVLRGPYAWDEYRPELIRRYLERLTPENVLVTVVAQGLDAQASTPWFEASYGLSIIDHRTARRWREAPVDVALALPEPNAFIPEDLSLKPLDRASASAVPRMVEEKRGFELWFKQDDTYRVPRTDFYFSVRSPRASDSARHAVLTRLYVALVNDALNERSYPAALAGLNFALYKHLRGVTVRLSGYGDKQPLLLSHIVRALRLPELDPERFEVLKRGLIRGLESSKQDRPYVRSQSELVGLLLSPYWSDEERLAALRSVSVADLESFVPRLLERVHVVALAHGNLHREEALAMGRTLQEALLAQASPTLVANGRVVKLGAGEEFVRQLESEHSDSAVVMYFQGESKSYAGRARALLLAQVLSAPLYNEIRTEQQLGYVVLSGAMPLLDVPGFGVTVQSPVAGPMELTDRVDAFLARYRGALRRMSQAEFERHKASLIARLLERAPRMRDRSDLYWEEIDRRQYAFDTRGRIADAVRKIGKREFVRLYNRYLLADRRCVVVRAAGLEHRGIAATQPVGDEALISDPRAFKRGKPRFTARELSAGLESGPG